MNAITQDTDPTLEIRTLIEQLQFAARDSRDKLREAELERNDLGSQLERALVQIDELRTNERELRSHFTEVASILRERDQAVSAAERNAQTASRAHEELAAIARQRDEAQRLREEAFRQRDEAIQRLEGLTRAYAESGNRSGEVQKQLVALRQARDSAHAQNLEAKNQIRALEDEIAELGFQRDAARKAQQQLEKEAADYRSEVQALTEQRDAAAAQIERLTAELDEQRKKFLDLVEQKTAIAQEGSDHAVALAEARAQVDSLTQERDAARSLTQAQSAELEKVRAQFHSFRENELRQASEELAATREKLNAFEAQTRQTQDEEQTLRQTLVALQEKVTTLEMLAEDATAHQEEAEMQLLSATQQGEADRQTLATVRHQLEEMTRERNSIRAKAEQTRLDLEAQLVDLRDRGASGAPLPGTEDVSSMRELQHRFERQRLQSVDLAAQLEGAQRQIRELSASLAEARLQVKFATASARQVSSAAPVPIPVPEPASLPLAELLAPMRECFHAYAQSPGEVGRLLDLHDRIVTYAERARLSDCIALYRLARAFAGLLESLAAAPGQANLSTLHTIEQTVDFFATAAARDTISHYRDPATARVLVVDDDAGNCQCVQLVMQEQMIQAQTAIDPSVALLELASEPFDLIFLDVNMPGMNGFELCQRLRELPLHVTTPVVFLTGFASDEVRQQAAASGGSDFLQKPFNLHELTVKALTLILRSQEETAEPAHA